MPTFVYDALDPSGRSVKGRVDADSENLVLTKLHDQNFHVISVLQQKRAARTLGVLPDLGLIRVGVHQVGSNNDEAQ